LRWAKARRGFLYYVRSQALREHLVFLLLSDTIFAIGAYYFSFPHSENAESPTHLQYFEQAFSLGSSVMTDCSLDNIHMLLAQCFFLLATGQSDR
jgi:hypothetical protein